MIDRIWVLKNGFKVAASYTNVAYFEALNLIIL